MSLSPAVRELILAFADDELVMGHRHSEWLGVAPFLEEDLAFASIAQDELGHARALYGLLTEDIDGLAFGRPPEGFRSCWLAELPGRPWEDALVRHILYDAAERLRWEALTFSSVPGLPGIADKALREEEYHRRHADSILERMLAGTEESQERVVAALARSIPFAGGLFEPTFGEAEAVLEGITTAGAMDLIGPWQDEVQALFEAVPADWSLLGGEGGRQGIRSSYFDELFGVMTDVLASDPDASW